MHCTLPPCLSMPSQKTGCNLTHDKKCSKCRRMGSNRRSAKGKEPGAKTQVTHNLVGDRKTGAGARHAARHTAIREIT